jgi:hypothetical protein
MEAIWQEDSQILTEALSVKSSLGSSQADRADKALASTSSGEKLTADIVLV